MSKRAGTFNKKDFKVITNKGPGQVVKIPDGFLMQFFGEQVREHLAENGGHFNADAVRASTDQ